MKILAIDPGEATGWALFDNENLVSQGTILGCAEGFLAWASLAMPGHELLVIESFIVEPGFVGRAHASEVIGVALAMSPAKKVFQSRGQKATLVRGTETERFNWLRSFGFSGVSHELDAISHCLIRLKLMGNKAAVQKYWTK